jgi:hypothetical protein
VKQWQIVKNECPHFREPVQSSATAALDNGFDYILVSYHFLLRLCSFLRTVNSRKYG